MSFVAKVIVGVGFSDLDNGHVFFLVGALERESFYTPQNQQLAPENGWLEDEISSWVPAYF